MNRQIIYCFVMLLVGGGVFFQSNASGANNEQAEQLFVRRIIPLFHEKCLACHGKDEAQIKGGLDMRTLASMLKGGESEQPALVIGKPAESPLYLAVTRKHDDWQPMPPKEADKLSAEQVTWIKDWLAGGAPWPDESRAKEIAKANAEKWSAEDGVTVKTSGGLSRPPAADHSHDRSETDRFPTNPKDPSCGCG